MKPTINKINSLELDLEKYSDSDLRAKTEIFKSRINAKESLDSILPEAFATVREVGKRVLGQRIFDVQLMGGIALHHGMIAQMKTGEGKTLSATLPVYLNALTENGVHVVTVNDYLAQRDSEWMGVIYRFLGLSVSCLIHSTPDDDRKKVYGADITYGTNNEFGFDYLRDNLKYAYSTMAQRELNYAIIDEVDSVLIDEARTPLIISGKSEDNSKIYGKINNIVLKLSQEDYDIDEKVRTVLLTDKGNEKIEKLLTQHGLIRSSLYDLENMIIIHHVNQALKAQKLFKHDIDYLIKDRKVMIIDEFTGRVLEGRRYSDGLHQAIEAKEGVPVQNENQTIASITFQNYFRMYKKLSGMTGTAITEAAEFEDIYKLRVVDIPANLPVIRKDCEDIIYRTEKEKYKAIVERIVEAHEIKQPILIGTISIAKSEHISSLLKKAKIPHNVLNAKYHEFEAQIIAQAGQPGAVTIATNMAGRGTDIMLGGNPEMLFKNKYKRHPSPLEDIYNAIKIQVEEDCEIVKKAGGLLVIGTERHEARRIDNQLRGRSGRKGDPGETVFFLSLEDDLMRLFGSERISNFLLKMGLKENEAIVHPWVSKSIEKAQQKVEARNYEIRKNLLQFDDVMGEQRSAIYHKRLQIMQNPEILVSLIKDMVLNVNQAIFENFIPKKSYKDNWDIVNLSKEILRIYGIHLDLNKYIDDDNLTDDDMLKMINQESISHIQAKQVDDPISKLDNKNMEDLDSKNSNLLHMQEDLNAEAELENSSQFIKVIQYIFLMTLDQLWKDHLHSLDRLRAGINLRAYAQKSPINEYKVEAFNLFKQMLNDLQEQVIQRISHISFHDGKNHDIMHDRIDDNVIASNISRNQICPCGSGKKYKHCHGAIN